MKLSSSKLLRIPGLSGGELYTIEFCIEMEHRVKMG